MAAGDAELLELTQELSTLGGVTAKIGGWSVYCDAAGGVPTLPTAVAVEDGCVLLKAPTAGAKQSRFAVTKAWASEAERRAGCAALAGEAAGQVVAGFHHTVVAVGGSPGAAELLFGDAVRPRERLPGDSVVGCFVEAVRCRAAAKYPSTLWQLALSCFEVRAPESKGKRGPVVDLLTSRASMADPPPDVARRLLQQYAGADGGAFLPFDALPAPLAMVALDQPEDCSQALNLALARSASWAAAANGHVSRAEVVPHGAAGHSHVVVRLTLLVPSRGACSCAHFVHVAGASEAAAGREPAGKWARQELMSLHRLFSEVALRCQGPRPGPPLDALPEPRDAVLPRLLAPLLGGNGQGTLLLTVTRGERPTELKALLALGPLLLSVAHPVVRGAFPAEEVQRWAAAVQRVDLPLAVRTWVAEQDILRPVGLGPGRSAFVAVKGTREGGAAHLAQQVMDRLTSSSTEASPSPEDRAAKSELGLPAAREAAAEGRRQEMQRRLAELTRSSEVLDSQRQTLLQVQRTLLQQRWPGEDADGHRPPSVLPATSSIAVAEDEGDDTAEGEAELRAYGLASRDPTPLPVALGQTEAAAPPIAPAESTATAGRGVAGGETADGRRESKAMQARQEIQALLLSLQIAPPPSQPPPPPPPQPLQPNHSPPPPLPQPEAGPTAVPGQHDGRRRSRSLGPAAVAEATPTLAQPAPGYAGLRRGRTTADPKRRGRSVGVAVHREEVEWTQDSVLDMQAWRAKVEQQRAQTQRHLTAELSGQPSLLGTDASGFANTTASTTLPEGDSSIIGFAVAAAAAITAPSAPGPAPAKRLAGPGPGAAGAGPAEDSARTRRLARQRQVVQQLEAQLHDLRQKGLAASLDPPPPPAVPEGPGVEERPSAPPERAAVEPAGRAARPGQTYQRLVDLREARCQGLVDRNCSDLSAAQAELLHGPRAVRFAAKPGAAAGAGGPSATPAEEPPAAAPRHGPTAPQGADGPPPPVGLCPGPQAPQSPSADPTLHPLLQIYERQMEALQAQVERLQRDNGTLAAQLCAVLPEDDALGPGRAGAGAGAGAAGGDVARHRRSQSAHAAPRDTPRRLQRLEMRERRSAFLERKLQDSTDQVRTLQAEVFALQRQVRLGGVNAKLLREAQERAEAMERKVQGSDALVVRLQREATEATEALRHAQSDVQRLHRREADLEGKVAALLRENQDVLAALRGELADQRVQELLSPTHRPLLGRVRLPGQRPTLARLLGVLRAGLQGLLQTASQQALCSQLATHQQLQAQGAAAKQQLGKLLAAVDDVAKEVDELEHELLDAALRESEYTQALVARHRP